MKGWITGGLIFVFLPWQAAAADFEFKTCVGTVEHNRGGASKKVFDYVVGKTFKGTLYGASCDPTAPFELDISFTAGDGLRVDWVEHWTKVVACNGGGTGTIKKKNRYVGENFVYIVTSWLAIVQEDGSLLMTEFDEYQNKAGTIPDSKLHATTVNGCISGLLKPQ